MYRISRLAGLVVMATMVVGCASITVLPDGRALIVSGIAKLYDPASGTVTITGTPDLTRITHTSTLLSDGRVLIVGGFADEKPVDSAALYDPAAGTFAPTGAPLEARSMHSATLLRDGRVLVVGGGVLSVGDEPAPPLSTAELYDPATGTFSATGALIGGRLVHTATLLADGRVLVIGGFAGSDTLATAELYDPATGTFSATGALTEARSLHTATLLADGRVLVVGGYPQSDSSGEGTSQPLTTAEIYDPASGTFTATGKLIEGRGGHTATLLGDGRVLIAGGMIPAESGTDALATAELYDPSTATFTATGSLTIKRAFHVAALLLDGRVLIAGPAVASTTTQQADPLGSAEIYDPATGTFGALDVEQWVPPTPCPTGTDGSCL